MKPYQERVVIEKSELDDKRKKLTEFIQNHELYNGLTNSEKVRLKYQLYIMDIYSEILGDRINNFV